MSAPCPSLDPESREDRRSKKPRDGIVVIFGAFLLIVLYVLSVGPAGWAVVRTGGPISKLFQSYEFLYKPIAIICGRNKTCGSLREKYFGLFGISSWDFVGGRGQVVSFPPTQCYFDQPLADLEEAEVEALEEKAIEKADQHEE